MKTAVLDIDEVISVICNDETYDYVSPQVDLSDPIEVSSTQITRIEQIYIINPKQLKRMLEQLAELDVTLVFLTAGKWDKQIINCIVDKIALTPPASMKVRSAAFHNCFDDLTWLQEHPEHASQYELGPDTPLDDNLVTKIQHADKAVRFIARYGPEAIKGAVILDDNYKHVESFRKKGGSGILATTNPDNYDSSFYQSFVTACTPAAENHFMTGTVLPWLPQLNNIFTPLTPLPFTKLLENNASTQSQGKTTMASQHKPKPGCHQ